MMQVESVGPASWVARVARSVAVGIVGPRSLTRMQNDWVKRELAAELRTVADGASERRLLAPLAAELEHEIASLALGEGFGLEVVVPAEAFRSSFDPTLRASFDALVAQAREQTTLTYAERSDRALDAAATFILFYSDVVWVVLDGDTTARADRGLSILGEARIHGRRVVLFDPLEQRVIRPAR